MMKNTQHACKEHKPRSLQHIIQLMFTLSLKSDYVQLFVVWRYKTHNMMIHVGQQRWMEMCI